MNIRDEIVEKRRQRIASHGHTMGCSVPEERRVPVLHFGSDPLVICEVKRRSPSKGVIAEELDPVKQVGLYAQSGITSVSVLTEEDYFSGSLADLMAVKEAFPGVAVLRKDFLVDVSDVDVSYRAGADAVLLIASMLTPPLLGAMLERARGLGMQALVEVHSLEDVEKVRPLRPQLMGINSRNLETFQVDLLDPLVLLPAIDWPARVVFESGIFQAHQAFWAGQAGFSGVLVGEAAVRNSRLPGLLGPALEQGIAAGRKGPESFWPVLARRLFSLRLGVGGGRKGYGGPLVKICGITNREDAELGVSLGADVLGLVFVPSPRQVGMETAAALADLPVLKAAVVYAGGPEFETALEAVRNGFIDVLQLHGDEEPEECWQIPVPWYKALRVKDRKVVDMASAYLSPRILFDAYHPDLRGGSGRTMDEGSLEAAGRQPGPWLAGGLNDRNIRGFLEGYEPELVDVSSGLEAEPGRKDPEKMKRFFEEIHNVRSR
ncbi:bifunctional indole-3-glycerol phosphate synthase/phosphoribosylanthranilate isomerase [Spirochaeta lutea]|uniref:N-(5'-phosphoribosyl)anthranilate isomerase n=1 Tax=Spirochaeta lutea TaxID=1480694 RepID=A0A098QYR7_9SPIO|nr:bifunctional indole-3-glycerol phosphate synthase/phosphoribosylanthranilate isomerase [Spirochaeta lutea]KGE71637.1 hypothetical protein DC28_10225 [Spirochaeta lutea]